jgi:hypothetical protein
MKNRAKCKLCESIIESFHTNDYVTCKCGEISVNGGNDFYGCSYKSQENFLRVDDEGNTIIPKFVEKEGDVKPLDIEPPKLTKKDLIKILEDMVKNIENMPQAAMLTSVNQYDIMALMMILVSIFKAKK